jgi:hypothetical protein
MANRLHNPVRKIPSDAPISERALSRDDISMASGIYRVSWASQVFISTV